MSSKFIPVQGETETVGDLITLLQQIPNDFKVSLSGMNGFDVVMDPEDKTVLMDDVNYIEELLQDQENQENEK